MPRMDKCKKPADSEAFNCFAAAGFCMPYINVYTRRSGIMRCALSRCADIIYALRIMYALRGQFYTNRYSVTVWYGLSGPNTEEGNCGLFGVSG